jgi:hypothetical protein
MELIFRRQHGGEMDRPPTQRDQFNNDDVELVDALVREALQNSLDARSGTDPVKVRFSLHEPSAAEAAALVKFLDLPRLRQHLQLCNMAPDGLDYEKPRVLVIEDFGTSGLLGSWDAWDEKPFCDFWRCMGRSHKGGKTLGRWGLGKLVFSSASRANVFYGLTTVTGDAARTCLMGQAVLTTHTTTDGTRYDSHGFFAERGEDDLQLPITNAAEIAAFQSATKVTRNGQAGLSIVVPYVRDTVTTKRLVQGVLNNYFFPILLCRLEVTVGDVTINAETFASLAKQHGGDRFADGQLATFIGNMRAVRQGEVVPTSLPKNWIDVGVENALGGALKPLRDQLQNGACLCLRAPILLKRKTGQEITTHVDLFVQRAAEGMSLFVRDTIVLPAEAKYFRGKQVFAALVADEKEVSSFLGDAENPAHTSWSASADLVEKNWRNPTARLREIRNALQRAYDALVVSMEITDPNALIDIFSAPAEAGARGRRPKGPIVRKPVIDPKPPTPRAYRLVRLLGGFALRADKGLSPEKLPFVIRVRAAYDVLRGNPFSKHDALDFDFENDELKVSAEGAVVTAQGSNVLLVKVTALQFDVEVRGFDQKRDLIIDPARVQ